MESYNESFPSNNTRIEEVPLFVTYLNMVLILLITAIVITPAVMVINVIRWTRELHTKYYFFVSNLLATDIANTIVRSALQYVAMILYLLDLNSDSTAIVLQWVVILPSWLLHLMTVLLPITIATERMIVIGFPYRHRSIMTTKTAALIQAGMWGLSIVLAIATIIIAPIGIVWPFGSISFDSAVFPFILIPRLTSTVFITAANVFLQYNIAKSNRKAKENERLGNEEEVKRLKKLVHLLRSQTKATVTLFLVGGIDVIANILIPVMYGIIYALVDPSKQIYFEELLMHPILTCVILAHSLVYGFYMKKIRKRLPKCMVCNGQWTTHRSRVGVIRQQP